MKLPKTCTLLVAVMITVMLLVTGCAVPGTGPAADPTKAPTTQPTDNQPAKPEPITFTMFSGDQSQAPAEDNPVVQKIRELTGVTIEFEFLVGDLFQKMGVIIASGDYPDLMNPSQARATAMEAGVFMPLDDLIPKYPNIAKHYAPYMKKLRAASGEAGVIYLLDNYGAYYGDWFPTYQNGPSFWIQKDVLADAGYPNPKTLDEYFTLIENYVKKYPTIDGQPTLGFEVLSYDWRSFCLKNPAQHLVGCPNDGDVVVDKETYVADLYQNKDYAKTYYKKLNEMYHKGIISAETFTQNYDQYLAKISQGRVVAMFDQYWNFESAEKVLTQEEKYNRTYVPVEITYPGYKGWYLEKPTFTGGNGMGLTTKCKDPERAMAYIDALLTEDMQKLMQWGIEGEHYHVGSDGLFYRTEEQRANARDKTWVLNNMADELWNQFPKFQGIFSDGNWCSPGEQPGELLAQQSKYDQGFLEKYGFKLTTEFLSPPPDSPDYYPVWGYTVPDGSDAKLAIDKITELENTRLPKIIISDANEFDAKWDAYQAELENSGYEAYLDFVNEEIQKRMK
jgi:putative aldouronate transport system substrate-binding protein